MRHIETKTAHLTQNIWLSSKLLLNTGQEFSVDSNLLTVYVQSHHFTQIGIDAVASLTQKIATIRLLNVLDEQRAVVENLQMKRADNRPIFGAGIWKDQKDLMCN